MTFTESIEIGIGILSLSAQVGLTEWRKEKTNDLVESPGRHRP